MIKICHTGDWHAYEKGGRLEELGLLLHQMADQAITEQVDLFLIAGDLHEGQSTPLERYILDGVITKMANHAPVIIIRGNHDQHMDLMGYANLNGAWPIMTMETAEIVEVDPVEGLQVICLPWIDKSALAARSGGTKEETDDLAIKGINDLLNVYRADHQKAHEQGKASILVGHTMVSGSEVSTGQRIAGMTVELSPTDLASCSDYAALGHIHKQQYWPGPVCYSGSPMRQDYGETEAKGWMLVKIHNDELVTDKPSSLITVEADFMELPARKIIHVDVPDPPVCDLEDIDQHLQEAPDLRGSLVRIRYSITSDMAHVINHKDLEALVKSHGAHEVKIERKIIHHQAVRSEAITKAESLWDAVSEALPPAVLDDLETGAALQAKLTRIETGHVSTAASRPGSVFLKALEFRGLTRFLNTVKINLEELGNGLIALVGKNGSGKTTILEALHAGLYRSMVSRPGSLYDHCHGTDALVDLKLRVRQGGAEGVSWGQAIHTRLNINAEKRNMESLFSYSQDALNPADAVMGAKAFDEKILEHMGSRDLMLSSVMASQDKSGSFLNMPRAKRRDLFAEMLGLAHIQEMAMEANIARADEEQALHSKDVQIKMLSNDLESLPRLREEKQQAHANSQQAEKALESAKADLKKAEDDLAALKLRHQELDGLSREQALAVEAHRAASRRQSETVANVSNIKAAMVATADSLEEAERMVSMEQEVREAGDLVKSLVDEINHADASSKDKHTAWEHWRKCRGKRESLGDKLKAIQEQARLLGDVPCTKAEEWMPADPGHEHAGLGVDLAGTCKLLLSARSADDAVPDLKDEHDLAKSAEDEAHAAYKAFPECDTTALHKQKDEAMVTSGKLLQVEQAKLNVQTLMERGAEQEEALQKAEEAMLDADGSLANAQIKSQEIKGRLVEATKGMPDEGNLKDTKTAEEARVSHHSQALKEHEAAWLSCDVQIQGLEAKEKAHITAKGEALILDAEISEWKILEKALGKEGVQALLLDAAAPEVSNIINDLLEACYGTRFQVSFQTLKQKRDGDMAEDFSLKVFDDGIERDADALSGGEKAIISEAVGLGLAIFNARRHGTHWEQIWRDETASALDPANADRYIQMLRKALELGAFKQCIFVAHLPAVWQAADMRLEVSDGQVTAS